MTENKLYRVSESRWNVKDGEPPVRDSYVAATSAVRALMTFAEKYGEFLAVNVQLEEREFLEAK